MSSIGQSQRSTLLSASLLHADWLNPVRLLARGGGEEESGGGGIAVHRGSEWTSTRTTTQSGSLEVRTRPFCSTSGLHPQQERERSERGGTGGREDGRRTPGWRCHAVIFSTRSQNHAGVAAVARRAASPRRGGSGLNPLPGDPRARTRRGSAMTGDRRPVEAS